jgi:nucleotide-binding universal stress UspA family protein
VLKTVVVALDSSEMSEKIIEALKLLQIQAETKIILAHVFPPPNPDSDLSVEKPHPSQESIYQQMEKQLQNHKEKLLGQFEIEIATGDPAEEIVRLANIYQANLIAIGSRGLRGVERIIEDSVSSQVVADSPCSVLVIKLGD